MRGSDNRSVMGSRLRAVRCVVLSCWVSNMGRFHMVSNGRLHFSVMRIFYFNNRSVVRIDMMHFVVESMRVNDSSRVSNNLGL